MLLKQMLLIYVFFFSALVMAGKPTDDQVIKDIKKPGMLDIKLADGDGSYSVYRLQRLWEKGVTIKRNAKLKEYPNANVIIGGVARYQIVGENYDYDTFKTIWNEYEGIPAPTDDEILSMVKKDMPIFVSQYNWNKIVGDIKGPVLSKDKKVRQVTWHSPKSFSIHMQADFSVISSYTEVQDKATIYEVRFYRDAVNQPWKNFISSTKKEEVIAKHQYSSDEIKAMPTLASKNAEKQAKSAASGLPSIQIPAFSNDKEAFTYIYTTLRTGNKKQIEAMLRGMMNSYKFVDGSSVQLSQQGHDMLNNTLAKVFDGKIPFAQSYCPQMLVKKYQTNMIEIFDALKKNKTRIALSVEGGRYERGKKVGQLYKISALEPWVLRTDDEVAQLKSWPFDELCAENEKSTKQMQSQAKPTSTAPSPAPSPKETTITVEAQPKTSNWVNYKSKYVPISMDVIGTPKESQKSSGSSISTTMMAQTTDGIFQMTASDYKKQLTAEIATPTHVKFAKNFIKANKSLIHNKRVVSFGTGDALEYLLERGSGNSKTMSSYRVFSHGTVVYQIMYSRNKANFDKSIAQQFFDSIKLD
jgi:hypothetical protein